MTGISINGKFLGATLNGVHRTAALYSKALLSNNAEGCDIELVSPRSVPSDFSRFNTRVLDSRFGSGQAWEMIALPMATRNRLLVNFCNLAPIAHSNSVVMIHDAQTLMYPKDYSGRQSMAYRMMLPIIGRRARLVLTVSEFAKRALVEYGVARENKIEVVYNGVDHLQAVKADQDVLGSNSLVHNGYALAFGSTKSYKNLELLFKVFARPNITELPIAIVGGPPREAYGHFDTKPPASALFLGPVSDAELKALYENAAMFLFPSKTEGFGLPPLEAMSCGCPVIAAKAGAMPEVCGDGAILVDPEDNAAWESAILQFCDPTEAAKFTPAATERARLFTWDRAGIRLQETLNNLVN